MYNRYIRNDNGVYTRVPQEETRHAPVQEKDSTPSPGEPKFNETHTSKGTTENTNWSDGLTGFLRHILDQLHLGHVDTGDLLLLILLFFLFREDADEELLVALGLLLIL